MSDLRYAIRGMLRNPSSVAGFSYRTVSLTGNGPATITHAGVVSGSFVGTLVPASLPGGCSF